MAVEELISQMQFVDIDVTKKKFNHLVDDYRQVEQIYRKEGIINLRIEFPYFEFMFMSNEALMQLQVADGNRVSLLNVHRPVPFHLFSIQVDYSNYDLSPPSVKLINPLDSNRTKSLMFKPWITPDQQDKNNLLHEAFLTQPQNILIQDNSGEFFFCLRGIKEYHEHPQHSGDSWFLYRKEGKGHILNILDQLQLYGISNFNKVVTQHTKTTQ